MTTTERDMETARGLAEELALIVARALEDKDYFEQAAGDRIQAIARALAAARAEEREGLINRTVKALNDCDKLFRHDAKAARITVIDLVDAVAAIRAQSDSPTPPSPKPEAGLTWTKEKPTKPGWYWYSGHGAPSMYEVVEWAEPGELRAYVHPNVATPIESMRGEWAGPLPMPSAQVGKE